MHAPALLHSPPARVCVHRMRVVSQPRPIHSRAGVRWHRQKQYCAPEPTMHWPPSSSCVPGGASRAVDSGGSTLDSELTK